MYNYTRSCAIVYFGRIFKPLLYDCGDETIKPQALKINRNIPHEVSMRSISEVMDLIGEEGMADYGIYWALTPFETTIENTPTQIGQGFVRFRTVYMQR